MPKKSSKRVPVRPTNPETAYFTDEDSSWVEDWIAAILTNPTTRPIALSRITSLLSGTSVHGVQAKHASQDAQNLLNEFVYKLQFKPTHGSIGAVDVFWHALLDYAKKHSSTEGVTETIYYWSENRLIEPAIDAVTPMRQETGEVSDTIDDSYITTSIACARLFSLGYGYTMFAWNALRDGLDVGGEDVISDSMRVASCAQLLAAGNRIRKWINGGGQEGKFKGFSDRWLEKPANPLGEPVWTTFVDALGKEWQKTKNDWVKAVIKATQEHIEYGRGDLTSDKVCFIIYEKEFKVAFHYDHDDDAPGDAFGNADAAAAAADGGGE